MKVLINFADDGYRRAQHLNTWTGRRIAHFDDVREYSPQDIDDAFIKENKKIFSEKRGNGLWLWKPYFILRTLHSLQEDDIVFYCDSGAFFVRNIEPLLLTLKEQDIWLSALPLVEKQFTQKSAFEGMNCIGKVYSESLQISATFLAIRKTKFTVQFVEEWLSYCCDISILKFQDSDVQIDGFIGHREDQSVLSLLAKKYDLPIFQDPSQFGKLPEKYCIPGANYVPFARHDYPVQIIHHRTGNADPVKIFKQLMCAVLPRRFGLKLIKNSPSRK